MRSLPILIADIRTKIVLIVVWGLDTLALSFTRHRKRCGGVAIIRVDAIGDFILWLDAAKEFRNLYPGEKITLIANAIWADIARRLPYWDEVVVVDVRRITQDIRYRWNLFRAIRKRGYEVAVQPTFSRRFSGDALIRATTALHRIGSAGDYSNISKLQKKISDRWYTQLVPVELTPLMELQRNAEFMRVLGCKNFIARGPKLPICTTLPEHLRIDGAYFIIFPGASWSGRCWPPTRFVAIANRHMQSSGQKAVICGGSADEATCRFVAKNIRGEAMNFAGRTSLPELVELVRGASLLIGNETSAAHIASAVRTPSVCILGGGHFGRFLPYQLQSREMIEPDIAVHRMHCFGCNWRCTQPHEKGGPMPCVLGVSFEDVAAACDRAMHAHPNRVTEE